MTIHKFLERCLIFDGFFVVVVVDTTLCKVYAKKLLKMKYTTIFQILHLQNNIIVCLIQLSWISLYTFFFNH